MVTADEDQFLYQTQFQNIIVTYLKPPPKGKISSEAEADFESK